MLFMFQGERQFKKVNFGGFSCWSSQTLLVTSLNSLIMNLNWKTRIQIKSIDLKLNTNFRILQDLINLPSFLSLRRLMRWIL